MRWSLRPAEPHEAEALLSIVEAGFATYRAFAPAGWEPPDESQHIERMQEEIAEPSSFTRVAEGEDAIAGFTHWIVSTRPSPDGTTPTLHLRHLFVQEPYWGSGLGLELHRVAVDAMDGRDARLFTPEPHARARRFYEREGWHAHDTFLEPAFGMRLVEYRRG